MDLNDVILPLHIAILIFSGWNILRADHLGFKWIVENVQVLAENDIKKYHTRVWIGLIGMMLTGFIMFLPMREFLLSRPQFYMKMSFVLALVLNGLAIGSLQKIATKKRFGELSTQEKAPLLVSGAISTLSWVGAATIAFFLIPD